MNRTDIPAFVKSERFVHVLTGIGFLIIALFVFEAGVAVGFHKAGFTRSWEEHYGDNFGAPVMYGMPARGLPDPHGASGTVMNVSLPTFGVAGPGRSEQIVEVGRGTIIRDGANTVDTSDIAPGKYVIVIGTPGERGEVDARLVRVLPAPDATSSPAKGQ
jgi:hypothetical protein